MPHRSGNRRFAALVTACALVATLAALTIPAGPAVAAGAGRPVVTKISAAKSRNAPAGGTKVTLHGHGLSRVKKVRFAGTVVPAHVVSDSTVTAKTPPHAPGLVPVVAIAPAGSSKVTKATHYRYTAPAYPLAWKTEVHPSAINLSAGESRGVSCPSTSFCASVTDGTVWTRTGPTWRAGGTAGRGEFTAVSCAAVSFCIAVTTKDRIDEWDGSTWAFRPGLVGEGGLTQVSCPAVGACLVLDSLGGLFTLSGSGSTSIAAPSTDRVQGISCATSSYCLGVWRNKYSIWNGSTWTTPGTVFAFDDPQDPTPLLDQVSCGAMNRCIAVGDQRAFLWNGSSWTEPDEPNFYAADFEDHVTCSSSTCVLISSSEYASILSGSTWGSPVAIERRGEFHNYDIAGPVSCASNTYCVAMDGIGQAASWNGTSWALMEPVLPSMGQLLSIACPSSTFCVLGDEQGNAYTLDGSTLSAPVPIDRTSYTTTSVACASAQRCVLVEGTGASGIWDGTSWSVEPGPARADAVSCLSGGDCYATGKRFERLHGSTWSVVSKSPLDEKFPYTVPQRSLSCTSSSFCAAVSAEGSSLFHGHGWSTPVAYKSEQYLPGVSCVSDDHCTALTPAGQIVTLTHGTWSVVGKRDQGGYIECESAVWCSAVSDAGDTYAVVGGYGSRHGAQLPDPASYGFRGLSCWAVGRCRALGDTYVEESALMH